MGIGWLPVSLTELYQLPSACEELSYDLNGSFFAESGLPVVLQKLSTVRVVSNSDLELSREPTGISPAAKRALLDPFSGEASFTSSAIFRRRLPRILLSKLSVPCDSRLWSR